MNLPDYLAVVAGSVQSGTDHNFPEDSYRANRGLPPFIKKQMFTGGTEDHFYYSADNQEARNRRQELAKKLYKAGLR